MNKIFSIFPFSSSSNNSNENYFLLAFDKFYVVLIFTFFILSIFTCQTESTETREARQKRVDAAVAQKLVERRIEKMQKCKADAVLIAEQRVDSILIAEAKLTSVDTVGKPLKPLKPAAPIVNLPKDSTDVKPLFDQQIDTIQ